MRFIWKEKLKRPMTGMLAALVFVYSCVGVVWAEEVSAGTVTEQSAEVTDTGTTGDSSVEIPAQSPTGPSVETPEVQVCTHSVTHLTGTVAATCTQAGYTGDTVCDSCGITVSTGSATAAAGHNVVNAVCTNCGKIYGSIKLEPQSKVLAGEEFKVDVVLEKNPEMASLKVEYVFDAERLELISVEDEQVLRGKFETGSGYFQWKEIQNQTDKTETIATLTFRAKEKLYGTTTIKIKKVEALDSASAEKEFAEIKETIIDVECGHEWDKGVVTKKASCDTDGVKTYTCTKDNSHTKTEVIPKTGHKWNSGTITKKAACDTDGVMTYTCQNDRSHTKTEAVPKLGHSWDKGEVIKEATCEEDGETVYTCQNNSGHTKTEIIEKLGHDYTIVDYKKPTKREDGYEKYECTRCKDEYTEVLEKTNPDGNVEYEYDDASGATSDSLTFYVGYFGMDFVKKTTLSLAEIQSNCAMVTQTYSYINKRPRVCYDVATGPLFTDVLELAGVDMGSVQSYLFATADSAGNYYDASQITNSNLMATRFFYPNLNLYFLEDGTFSDKYAARAGASTVEPMLAIWDSWVVYGTEQEFEESVHASNMRSGNCFRLLYGQSRIDEVSAISSAKWVNTVYVQYTGEPAIDAGDDLNLQISSDHTVSAKVSALDETLTEVFQNSVRWSSSDESVLKVDAVTGKITIVGEGTAVITATTQVEGVSATDSITVNISADEDEDLEGGGNGNGTGSGNGDGTGDGSGGSGTGTGDGGNVGAGDNGSGNGTGADTKPGEIKDAENSSVNDITAEEEASAEAVEESEADAEEEKIEIMESEDLIKNIGKTIKAIPLRVGEKITQEQSGGKSGGGESGNIVLSLTQQTMWYWAALFAGVMLVSGGGLMYRKYKREF